MIMLVGVLLFIAFDVLITVLLCRAYYRDGKSDGTSRFMVHRCQYGDNYTIGCLRCLESIMRVHQSPPAVPAGTKPTAPFHTANWRCDCKDCVAAYSFGRPRV